MAKQPEPRTVEVYHPCTPDILKAYEGERVILSTDGHREVGTIVRDERCLPYERWILRKRKQGHVIGSQSSIVRRETRLDIRW